MPGLDRRARSGLRGLEDDVGGFPAFSGLADSELLADLERIAAAITEVHPNPDAVLDRDGEWFEVLNPGPRALDLEGLLVHDDGLDVFEVEGRLVVPAGKRIVFGTNADPTTNGGVAVGYAYTYFPDGFQMRNTSDAIVLEMGGVAIDRVAYAEGWPHAAGQAMQLDPAAIDPVLNDEPERCFAALAPYGTGDLGSPGEPNPACAP